MMMKKPEPGEYLPYAIMYIDLVPDGEEVSRYLQEQLDEVRGLIAPLSEEEASTPCAEGEWTIKEILVHIMDTERIFAYRALRAARGDQTALPSFEQDDYVPASGANARSLASIMEEYGAIRMATLTLVNSLPEENHTWQTTASGHALSVRAVVNMIIGHEKHHVESIKENYL